MTATNSEDLALPKGPLLVTGATGHTAPNINEALS